jgi:hypothetical protein
MKYILIAFIGLLISCKTSETLQTSNLVKAETSWLTTPSFEVNLTTAYPFVTNELNQLSTNNLLGAGNSANQINLLGRGDFLRITENRVEANMSYYGTQRFGSFKNGNTGILLNDPVENYVYSFNEKKNKTLITFKTTHKQEHYSFRIIVYKSGHCDVDVTSSNRNFIKYDGTIKELVVE